MSSAKETNQDPTNDAADELPNILTEIGMTSVVDVGKMASTFAALVLLVTAGVCAATSQGDAMELWRSIEQLANASARGHKAVVDTWPGQHLVLRREGAAGLDGGDFQVSESLWVTKSDVRLDGAGKLILISLDVAGECITRADLRKQYPHASTLAWPQPHNPNPYSYESVDIGGAEALFGFPNKGPRCLFNVVVKPRLQARVK